MLAKRGSRLVFPMQGGVQRETVDLVYKHSVIPEKFRKFCAVSREMLSDYRRYWSDIRALLAVLLLLLLFNVRFAFSSSRRSSFHVFRVPRPWRQKDCPLSTFSGL
jgi:hypothetical protein